MTTPVSKCCRAETRVHSGDEGTNYMECVKCGEACDYAEEDKMSEKRLFDVKKIGNIVSNYALMDVELKSVYDQIDFEIRRNIKEFAKEIKSDMDGAGCLQYAYFIKSALAKRGIK